MYNQYTSIIVIIDWTTRTHLNEALLVDLLGLLVQFVLVVGAVLLFKGRDPGLPLVDEVLTLGNALLVLGALPHQDLLSPPLLS